MKYVVVLGDGMADEKIERIGNKTPLQVAKKPYIDALAKKAEVGLCLTVPKHMSPGSDVANLSVLGYDPEKYYTGRSPLEAANIGIDLKDTDMTLRANLITVSDDEGYENKTILDYSGGESPTEESRELVKALKKELDNDFLTLYSGITYRQCLVVDNGSMNVEFQPPHNIVGEKTGDNMPKGDMADVYADLLKRSYEILDKHPINLERVKKGENKANSLWFWGNGKKPLLDSFEGKFNLKGGMISAVDLLKGIAKLTDMENIEVEGATGTYDTNFIGKAQKAVEALKNGLDFVYIHMEAPDECGHHKDLENKIYSIEQIDEKVVKYLVSELDKLGEDYGILIMPDHPTPVRNGKHSGEPVPYLLYRSDKDLSNGANSYDEDEAKKTGAYAPVGHKLIERLFEK
ncbi:MAG: cofactor-independent phosphoglycerate mutase [Clostridia bacterium]|nr:cofactor-independent phosphoglycerate mutase [Clostridia bacterium]